MKTNIHRVEQEMQSTYLTHSSGYTAESICRILILLFITLIFLSACNSSEENIDASQTIGNNKLQVADALYFDKRIPDDFYHEKSSDDLYASISHVKNTALLPVNVRDGVSVYELSSDDFVEAMSWDEQARVYQPLYSQLVDNSETELYYQFTRVNPDLPEFKDISRVFKASMLDRTGVNRNEEDGEYQGKITVSDFNAAEIKKLIEYLWMFSYSNNYSNAVLESYTNETAEEFIHTMKQAKINFSTDASCDEILLYEMRYSINKETGLIWKDKELIDTFTTKRDGASVEMCE